jgi:hypothetical protein
MASEAGMSQRIFFFMKIIIQSGYATALFIFYWHKFFQSMTPSQ